MCGKITKYGKRHRYLLSTLFLKEIFRHKAPSLVRFHQYMEEKIPEEERPDFIFRVYRAAILSWDELPLLYHRFIVHLIHSDRQRFLDYLRQHTPLGDLSFTPPDPQRLLKLLHSYWEGLKRDEISLTGIAFALSLGFSFRLNLNTLSDHLRYERMDSDELLDLLGKISLHDLDEM